MAARFEIQEIDLAKHYGLQVTDRNGTQALFALEEMDRQLKRLDTYLQYTDQHGQRIQTINLLVQKNVPVTYMVETASTDKPADALAATANPATPAPPAKAAAASGKEKSADKEKKNGGRDKKAGPTEKKGEAKPTHKDHAPQPFLKPAARVTPAGIQ